jgi:hypothetical protein
MAYDAGEVSQGEDEKGAPPQVVRKASARWKSGAIGTLVLGAIGSALWDVGLKPMFSVFRNLILTLTSLGIDSVRNSAYVEAARGFHEHASTDWLVYFWALAIGFWLAVTTGEFKRPTVASRRTALSREDHASVQARKARLTILARVLGVVTLLFMGVLLGITLRNTYSTTATAYFEQLHSVIAPTLTEGQRLSLRSRYSQIRSRAEYIALTNEMAAIARRNRMHVPSFTPW